MIAELNSFPASYYSFFCDPAKIHAEQVPDL